MATKPSQTLNYNRPNVVNNSGTANFTPALQNITNSNNTAERRRIDSLRRQSLRRELGL